MTGFATAGLAIAAQRAVTSFAGYLVVMRGHTFTVGIASRWAACAATSSRFQSHRRRLRQCFYVIFAGQRPLTDYIVGYFVPVLLGNTLGGVVFVAALAHAQHGPSVVTGARGARRVRQS